MKILDTIKISQSNLLRAKPRTFLTIAAVFIGALTLSLTNGVGNGIKTYVNEQIGNVDAKDTLVIQIKEESNPTGDALRKYDPDRKRGDYNEAILGENDITKIQQISGIVEVIPQYNVQLEYVTIGGNKYESSATQYIEGLTLEMSAGSTVQPNSLDTVTIPDTYLAQLGFTSDRQALGKPLTIAFKDVSGNIIEKQVKIVGVQKQSLLDNPNINISSELAKEINNMQTQGVSSLAESYQSAIAKYDSSFNSTQVSDLKQHLDQAGYSAQTIEEQNGTVGKIINIILIVLNVFGAITLLAAGFGIINTLLMSVNERTSEIGLMKAVGANRRTIFLIFAFEAASIGFWGSLLGVLASMGIGAVASKMAGQTFLKNFVGFQLVAFPILPSLVVLFGVVALAFLAGSLPSLKASKLDPIKALRYE